MIVTDRRRWERHPYDHVAPDPAWPQRVPLWQVIEAHDYAVQFARRAWLDGVKRRLGIREAGDLADLELIARYGTCCICGGPMNGRLADEGEGNMRLEAYCTREGEHPEWPLIPLRALL